MNPFRILVLDGGGSKGIYTLGVLKELELKLGSPLCQHFQLIYGTSTGSIIAALIALGKTIPEIEKLYFDLIPKIMKGNSREAKSANLKYEADIVFERKSFDEFKTDIGIVALNYDRQVPLIFKSNINQAHGMKQSFLPGFGCTISEAVQCSCSAYPIFDIKKVQTKNQGEINAIDGGYVANNATLFAMIDAYKAFGNSEDNIRVLSVGVGSYIEKPFNWKYRLLRRNQIVQFVERVLSSNTNTNSIVAKLLFTKVHLVRVSDTFNEPEYGTNMIEMDSDKLKKLSQLGRNSYASHEKEITGLFNAAT